MGPYSPRPSDRYAVVAAFHAKHGPSVSFWPEVKDVVRLLARHCQSNCGQGISVWQRRGSDGKWQPMSDTQ